jgi:hypothetical protein
MSEWRKELQNSMIETSFKQISDGYLFRHNPWLLNLGPAQHFRINEAQKAALTSAMRLVLQRIWTIAIAWWVIATTVLIAGAVWFAINGYPRVLILPFVILIVAPFILLTHYCKAWTLGPLLVDLPHSDERITSRETIGKLARRVPLSYFLAMLGIFALILVGNVLALIEAVQEGRSTGTWYLTTMAVNACLVVYFGYLAIVGRRSAPSKEPSRSPGT